MLKRKTNDQIIFEFVMLLVTLAYDASNRGKKGKRAKVDKLGRELVKRDILTIEQVETLLMY